MSFTGPDDISAIVADIGSTYTKVGFAGTDAPTAFLPTNAVSLPHRMQIVAQSLAETAPSTTSARRYGKASRYSFDIMHPEDNTVFKSPLVDGLVEDWDMMEAVVDYAVLERLKGGATSGAPLDVSLAGHPFLLADHLNASKADRERWCQLLFEKYKCPGVFISKAGVLAVYANARTTGLAVDMGGGAITVTPVQDGFPLMMGARVHPCGGQMLDTQFLEALTARKINIQPQIPSFSSQSGMALEGGSAGYKSWHSSVSNYFVGDVVRELREAVCAVNETALDMELQAHAPTMSYVLPDGQRIQIGAERFSVPELLFDPSNLSSRFPGLQPLHLTLVSAAMGCEPESRKDIVNNIVLTGGASAMKGVGERLMAELLPVAPVGTRPKLACASPEERKLGAWLGGSILGSLGTFHDLWFSAEEYKEHGAKMLHRKCP